MVTARVPIQAILTFYIMLQLSSEKHAIEAELRAEQSKLSRTEAEYSTERNRLNNELAKARQAETDALKEATDAQKRAREAAAARDILKLQTDERSDILHGQPLIWRENILKIRPAILEALCRRFGRIAVLPHCHCL